MDLHQTCRQVLLYSDAAAAIHLPIMQNTPKEQLQSDAPRIA